MALELIGKTAPLPGDLERAAEDGLKKIELYLREEFLTDRHLKFLSDARRDHGMSYYSVHTPHSDPGVFQEVLRRTGEFASGAGAKVVVVHSSQVDVFSGPVLAALKPGMFPENGLRHDLPFLERIFKRGVRICFDTAHFYVASMGSGRDYYEDVRTLFERHAKMIGHVHIADATGDFIGKPRIDAKESYDANIEEGEIDFIELMPVLKRHYKGVAVVEVDNARQAGDIEKIRKILSGPRRRA